MKIKQLKEKTIKGLVDFLPKIGIDDIPSLRDIINNIKTALNDKLSKSQGGEINKPIVVTNSNSNHSITINPDGSIYVWNKKYSNNIMSIKGNEYNEIEISGTYLYFNKVFGINNKSDIKDTRINASIMHANKFIKYDATSNDVLLGDGSTTRKLVSYISTSPQSDCYIVNILNIGGAHDSFAIPGATKELAGLMTAADKTKLDDVPNIYAEKSEAFKTIEIKQAGEDENDFDTGVTIFMDYANPATAGQMVVIDNATATKDGCMSHEDKKALDDIPNTYLPLSGGKMTGTLNIDSDNSIQIIEHDNNPNNIYINNRGIIIESLDGDTSNVLSKTEINSDSITTPNATFTNKVRANGFVANNSGGSNKIWTTDGNSIPIDKAGGVPTLNANGKVSATQIDNLREYISSQDSAIYSIYDEENKNYVLNIIGNLDEDSYGSILLGYTENGEPKTSIELDGANGNVIANGFMSINIGTRSEIWCTDGSSINLLNFLSSYVAIHVVGTLAIAERGIDNTTVIDSPDEIIFDKSVLGGRFLARKSLVCYVHWKADISKNIAPPSRYGIETDNGVFPFNNQLYKFNELDGLYTATCSNGTCTMNKLTL